MECFFRTIVYTAHAENTFGAVFTASGIVKHVHVHWTCLLYTSFDIYSLYYAPVQILTGLMAGWMFRTKWLRGYRLPIGGLALSLPTSIASAAITAFLFGGITSSGSSYLVVLMSKLGMNLTLSCFLVQVLTDYADKLIAVLDVYKRQGDSRR